LSMIITFILTIMFNFHMQIYVLWIYIIERSLCFDYFVTVQFFFSVMMCIVI
jgi:hypothetical protein